MKCKPRERMKKMPVMIETEENTVTALLSGEIDHHNSVSLRADIDKAIEDGKPDALILDFGNVTFMDSSGIGLVMGRYKAVQPYGGKVTVKNPSTQIKKVMRLAGLDRLTTII